MKIKKPVSAPETQRKIKRSYLTVATVAAAAIVMALPEACPGSLHGSHRTIQ